MKTKLATINETVETNGSSFLATPDLDMNHAQEVSGGGIVRGVLGLFGGVFDSACKLGGFLWGILW